MGKERLIIGEEDTRPITSDDITQPGRDGQRGPVKRIGDACRQYEAALRVMRQTLHGAKTVPKAVLKIGAERRRKIKQVLAETPPGQRDELQEEGGLVSRITATVRGKKAA